MTDLHLQNAFYTENLMLLILHFMHQNLTLQAPSTLALAHDLSNVGCAEERVLGVDTIENPFVDDDVDALLDARSLRRRQVGGSFGNFGCFGRGGALGAVDRASGGWGLMTRAPFVPEAREAFKWKTVGFDQVEYGLHMCDPMDQRGRLPP